MFLRIFLCCCCLLLKMFVSQRKFLQIYFASTSPTRKQASNTRAEHSRELDLLREMERKRSSSFHKQKRSFHVIPFKFSPLPNKSETLLCPKGSAITPPPLEKWRKGSPQMADGRRCPIGPHLQQNLIVLLALTDFEEWPRTQNQNQQFFFLKKFSICENLARKIYLEKLFLIKICLT